MANKKISQLTPGTALVGTEPIPTVQGGVTVSTTPNAISDLIKPYKVYTALLTQSGGDDPQTITSGNLTIGVTYMMDGITLTTDFTNVGAPYNANGVYFVATGTTPNNWGAADLNYNTGAPVATVLENTIGDIWFTYDSTGGYSAQSSIYVADSKTTALLSPNGYVESPTDIYKYDLLWSNNNTNGVYILTYYNNESTDDVLNYGGAAMIEIRVYN